MKKTLLSYNISENGIESWLYFITYNYNDINKLKVSLQKETRYEERGGVKRTNTQTIELTGKDVTALREVFNEAFKS